MQRGRGNAAAAVVEFERDKGAAGTLPLACPRARIELALRGRELLQLGANRDFSTTGVERIERVAQQTIQHRHHRFHIERQRGQIAGQLPVHLHSLRGELPLPRFEGRCGDLRTDGLLEGHGTRFGKA